MIFTTGSVILFMLAALIFGAAVAWLFHDWLDNTPRDFHQWKETELALVCEKCKTEIPHICIKVSNA